MNAKRVADSVMGTPGLEDRLPEFVNLARNPVPSGARLGWLQHADGRRLRYAVWRASRSPLKGTVCVFPGRGEYIEKYFEVVADLRRRGHGVAMLDWRGQGLSDGTLRGGLRGHVKSFEEYDLDLLRFMKDVVLPDCLPPFYALGHSMGGNILLRSAQMQTNWFDRMVLTAPMVRILPTRLRGPHSVIRPAVEIACSLGLGRSYPFRASSRPFELYPFEDNPLTSDEQRFMRSRAVLEAEPRLWLGTPTYGWVRAALRSSARLMSESFPKDIRVPLLMLSGTEDTIVDNEAIETVAVRSKMATHIAIPGARHELLHERDELRRQAWAAFDAFVSDDDMLAA